MDINPASDVPMKLLGRDKLLSLGPDFRLSRLATVTRLELYRPLLERPSRFWAYYDMRLLLRTNQAPHFWAEFQCSNVIHLKVEQSGSGLLGLIYFALNDISSRGLEEGRWEITDTDGDLLTFQCYEITVLRAGAGEVPARHAE